MASSINNKNGVRMPTLFISHGAGPCFFMTVPPGSPFSAIDSKSEAVKLYTSLASRLGLTSSPSSSSSSPSSSSKYGEPSSIIVFSAHWETSSAIEITSQSTHTDLLYDYSGFPADTYALKYSPPGSPPLSQRIKEILNSNGVDAAINTHRNFDHGVFVPLKLIFPQANIPVVQVSIHASLSAEFHIRIGKLLSPLREEGVLITASGQANHGRGTATQQLTFVRELTQLLTSDKYTAEKREEFLKNWETLPYARATHTREEHLVPLFVVAAAAGFSKAEQVIDFTVPDMGMSLASFAFP